MPSSFDAMKANKGYNGHYTPHDPWADDNDPIIEERFFAPRLDDGTRAAANVAVAEAIAAFDKQRWYETAYARIRFGLFWATYWLRLQVAGFLIRKLNYDAIKTFRKLGL